MNAAALHRHCRTLTAATHDVKWGADQVYSVGAKMFAVFCEHDDGRVSLSFKVDDDLFLQYTDREGFIPAPYMARNKWVMVEDSRKQSAAELKALLKRSHELVAAKLTRKLRSELGLA